MGDRDTECRDKANRNFAAWYKASKKEQPMPSNLEACGPLEPSEATELADECSAVALVCDNFLEAKESAAVVRQSATMLRSLIAEVGWFKQETARLSAETEQRRVEIERLKAERTALVERLEELATEWQTWKADEYSNALSAILAESVPQAKE